VRHMRLCRAARDGMSRPSTLSHKVMIRTSRSLQERPAGGRKLLGGIGLLVFLGAFFVMPLCAALAICSMPCCEHGDQNGGAALASADMMACETECAIRSDDATTAPAPTVAPDKSSDGKAVAMVVLDPAPAPAAVPASATSRHSEGFLHHSDAPLHVLNSIFRI
jgi:hypothetical protein